MTGPVVDGGLGSAVRDYLTADGWPHRELPDSAGIEVGYQGENGRWPVYVLTDDDVGLCIVYSMSPVQVPEDARAAVCEFLTRINYGLTVGGFEMDLADGEVRFRTSVAVGEAVVPVEIIHRLLHLNVLAMDRHLPGLLALVADASDVEGALGRIDLATG